MPFPVHDLESFLTGVWSFSRTILPLSEDKAQMTAEPALCSRYRRGYISLAPQEPQGHQGHRGHEGVMRGEAVFSKTSWGLHYAETGILTTPHYGGTFNQIYLLKYDSYTPTKAQVCFSDHRPFFILDLSTGRQEITHLCGTDRYQAILSAQENSLKCQWTVSGPRKSYSLISVLRKK